MTGTVLPDGSVGPVSGVPIKIRAAAQAGFTRVLVPANLPPELDPETGELVNLSEAGQQVGVEVVPVSSVAEAYALMTGQPVAPPGDAPATIDPAVQDVLAQRSRLMVGSATAGLADLRSGAGAGGQSAQVRRLIAAAREALGDDDPVLAFASAAEAEQLVRQLAAEARISAVPAAVPVERLVERVRRSAVADRDQLSADLRTNAETPVSMVEQLPALADALSWGVFALASTEVVLKRLDTVRTRAQLQQVVRFFETGRFEGEVYMSTCVAVVALVGRRPIADMADTVGFFDAYADLLDYSSDSNRTYAKSLGIGVDPGDYLSQLMSESDQLTDSVAEQFPGLSGPTAEVSLRMAAALQDYVDSPPWWMR